MPRASKLSASITRTPTAPPAPPNRPPARLALVRSSDYVGGKRRSPRHRRLDADGRFLEVPTGGNHLIRAATVSERPRTRIRAASALRNNPNGALAPDELAGEGFAVQHRLRIGLG